jgi:hypothetical protein
VAALWLRKDPVTNTATPETETVTGELVPVSVNRMTIFDIRDTEEQLAEAQRQATAVTKIIDSRKLSMRIGRSEHVLFEGWATLGAFNGLSVHTVWTKPLEDGTGWEAKAEVRTLDGRVVGTAEAMCSRNEKNWAKADDYAIRSMAQTRAGSKAFKGPLSWVMVLAGKSATPAEEVDGTDGGSGAPLPAWANLLPDNEVRDFGNAVQDILTAAGDPETPKHVGEIGEAIWAQCDGIPRAVDHAIQLIAARISAKTEPATGPPGGWAAGSGIDAEPTT